SFPTRRSSDLTAAPCMRWLCISWVKRWRRHEGYVDAIAAPDTIGRPAAGGLLESAERYAVAKRHGLCAPAPGRRALVGHGCQQGSRRRTHAPLRPRQGQSLYGDGQELHPDERWPDVSRI